MKVILLQSASHYTRKLFYPIILLESYVIAIYNVTVILLHCAFYWKSILLESHFRELYNTSIDGSENGEGGGFISDLGGGLLSFLQISIFNLFFIIPKVGYRKQAEFGYTFSVCAPTVGVEEFGFELFHS